MRKSVTYIFTSFCVITLVLQSVSFFTPQAHAATIEELQKNIAEKASQIDALNKEIEILDKKVQVVNNQSKTLQNTIQILDTSAKKLSTEVKVTENKISKTDLNIQEIGLEIDAKEQKIDRNMRTVAQTLREINSAENNSLIEIILSKTSLSALWDNIEMMQKFQTSIQEQTNTLHDYKTELETKQEKSKSLKADLEDLKNQLVDKKKIVDINKQDKAMLLITTKNEEATYKKMIAEKKALYDAFQKEIFDIESQIKIAIDPNSIPKALKGLLSWPVDKVVITQYFGDTSFSKTGAYNGKGHNGIDFGVTKGTPVRAVLSGVVEETGNTDLKSGCYSYGKWVFIRHYNGLASVYGHLSLVTAKAGDKVKTGDIVAYSGSTGYSTGPHLHLSLFASQGVSVQPLVNSVNCKNMRIPIASQNAYLDPFPYF